MNMTLLFAVAAAGWLFMGLLPLALVAGAVAYVKKGTRAAAAVAVVMLVALPLLAAAVAVGAALSGAVPAL